MSLQHEPLLLDQVLDAAIETARPVIEEPGHRLEQRRGTARVSLGGDLARLSQVFANLLNNAAKHASNGGTISIFITAHPTSVDVEVTDTGQGIATDRLDSIFDLFARGSGNSDTTVGGLGIGLALARTLVELHDGTLTVSSPGVGSGSTFTVSLPTIRRAERTHEERQRTEPVARNLGRRVLVVDDGVDAADTTAALLTVAGCVTRVVYSGDEALAQIIDFKPVMALLDIGMPAVDGLAVCRQIRSLPQGKSLFIVAITGWGQDDDRRKTVEAGFDAHLVKPVAPDALLHLVEHAPLGT